MLNLCSHSANFSIASLSLKPRGKSSSEIVGLKPRNYPFQQSDFAPARYSLRGYCAEANILNVIYWFYGQTDIR